MTDTLKLEDLAPDRMTVELPSGETTPMLDPRELSMQDRAEIGRLAQQLVKLNKKAFSESSKPEDVQQLEKVLRDLTRRVLPEASPELIASMPAPHLDQVTGAFLGRYAAMTNGVAKTVREQMPEGMTGIPAG